MDINVKNTLNLPSNLRTRRRRLLAVIIFVIIILLYQNFYQYIIDTLRQKFRNNGTYFQLETTICPIPKLDPYHASIKHLITVPKRPNCDRLPLLFNSTLDSRIVPVDPSKFEELKIKKCVYRVVRRAAEYLSENLFSLAEKSFPVSLVNSTKVLKDHEFIAILCEQQFVGGSKVFDVHAFVHIKPEVERMLSKNVFEYRRSHLSPLNQEIMPNVLIFGLDAISHMNFRRTFPQSYEYLMNNLSSLNMEGYNKVGENTFPNIIPLLTSLSESAADESCGKMKKYDNCPFIWKEFAKRGYRTAFAEDSPPVSIFNHRRKGFKKSPTHYYLRPYSLVSDFYTGSNPRLFVNMCQGPRLGFENMLDYMRKFVYTMERNKDRPYFYFSWTTSLTHDDVNDGLLGDGQFLETLQWLYNSRYMEKTILIVMSDHGSRIGTIRRYPQGQLEDRMPLLLIRLPKFFQEKFKSSFENAKINQGRLLTTYDLHETLLDLLNLNENGSHLRKAPVVGGKKSRGISVFQEIPINRTCLDAGISDIFCACNLVHQVPVNTTSVLEGAGVAVKFINDLIINKSACAQLSLVSITDAQKVGGQMSTPKLEVESYIIRFITSPGRGEFEGYVKKIINRENKKDIVHWGCGGVVRTNSYGEQSHCVSEALLKNFCYCIQKPQSIQV